MPHYQGVGCDRCREVLSAGLDDEATSSERAGADAHAATCAECRRWLDDAAAVTRLARASLVTGGGIDVTEQVLAAAPGRRRAAFATVLRALLLALGIAQLMLATLQVTALSVDSHVHNEAARGGATPGHLWHESAAWNAAVGIAFIWVATRRTRPAGVIAILSAFIGALLLLSIDDLIAGRVEPSRLSSHGFIVAGYVIVLALFAPRLRLVGPPGHSAGKGAPPAASSARDEAGLAPVIHLPRDARATCRDRWRDAA
jgi:predicted anti-sigma-YlaC factor YlaD